jgi:cysteine desulfurase/selenocysteine lyase
VTTLLPASTYDVEAVRADFPVLSRQVGGRPLVYLDNASSSHKPRQVLDAERDFVEQHYSNVHRGVHTLSQEATDAYEAARDTVAAFLGAADSHEVVFTKNATEAYNLVAYSFGNAAAGSRFAIGPGDEVCVTEMEHHSNLVPWQMLCERTGATLRWIPLTDDGRLDLTDLDALVNERTKVLACVHRSDERRGGTEC